MMAITCNYVPSYINKYPFDNPRNATQVSQHLWNMKQTKTPKFEKDESTRVIIGSGPIGRTCDKKKNKKKEKKGKKRETVPVPLSWSNSTSLSQYRVVRYTVGRYLSPFFSSTFWSVFFPIPFKLPSSIYGFRICNPSSNNKP